jgi:enhancing lycopene biosynthesis protein 2
MAKIGVVLAGCGVFDGSEIHEAVCVLLALDQAGAQYQCMAPNAPQLHVVNHIEKKPSGESRNILVESARIARGNILALDKVSVEDYDGFIFPGGFGAAKNLCTFAIDGPACQVNPDVTRVIKAAYHAKKPLAFVCIAPVLAAKVLGNENIPAGLTIGDDEETAEAINDMGAKHYICSVREAHIDAEHRIISTPAYMKAQSISEVYAGAQSTVDALLKLAGN